MTIPTIDQIRDSLDALAPGDRPVRGGRGWG
jgi:hypothetical protein